jgi:CRP/FNR family transcriptional regulator
LYDGLKSILSDDEWTKIYENSMLIEYGKNETVIKQGKYADYLLWLEEGHVKLNINIHTRQYLLNIFGPGRFVGMSFILTSLNHAFSVTSLTFSKVLLIRTETIRELIKQNGRFAYRLMETITNTLHDYLYNYILLEKRNHMHGRLARILIYLSRDVYRSHKFNILINRDELADMVLMSRENAIKVLNDFRRENIIDLKGKEIEILNMEKLKTMIEKA